MGSSPKIIAIPGAPGTYVVNATADGRPNFLKICGGGEEGRPGEEVDAVRVDHPDGKTEYLCGEAARKKLEPLGFWPLPTSWWKFQEDVHVVMVQRIGSGKPATGTKRSAAGVRPPTVVDRLYKKWRRRPMRADTNKIILHTTEGGAEGSLNRLRTFGLAHYMVDRDGTIFRIMPDGKKAEHAGTSMWNGQTIMSDHSVGIEVVGHHYEEPTTEQYGALKGLLSTLKKKYNLRDADVLSHAHIAYGLGKIDNPDHDEDFRGRKRCGMIFANRYVREKLGLRPDSGPKEDPDFHKGRLIVVDSGLAEVLYGTGGQTQVAELTKAIKAAESNVVSKTNSAWFIARDAYDAPTTIYTFPDKTTARGDEIVDWGAIPVGTVVSVDAQAPERGFAIARFKKAGKAQQLAGKAARASTTIYFLNDGRVRTGAELEAEHFDFDAVPAGTGVAVGYVYGGEVGPKRSMMSICKTKWNDPSTIYRLPDGTIHTGDTIDEKRVPRKTLILFRR